MTDNLTLKTTPAEPSLPTLAEYPPEARAADKARWAAEDREDEIDDTHWRVAKAFKER